MSSDPTALPPPSEPSRRRTGWRGALLILSLLANLALVVLLVMSVAGTEDDDQEPHLLERHYSGDPSAADKVAILKINGVLFEGSTGPVHKQVEKAAKDRAVKAVVVRIDSPGGTISASEAIHQSLTQLRDNTHTRFAGTGPKPLVASMGSVAASGGYYVAMPARKVVAEPTTITGSIGVYAALPNVAQLAEDNGVRVILVKAGDLKAGGSPFQPLSPAERQPWQDMVNHAYERFLTVVAQGRPGLTRERLISETTTRQVPKYDDRGNPVLDPAGKPVQVPVTRYRADGGTFTPPQARDLGLIDEIVGLDEAVRMAAEAAGLNRYRSVTYEREKGLAELLFGVDMRQSRSPNPAQTLTSALTPRLLYLTPGYEVAGLAPPGDQ